MASFRNATLLVCAAVALMASLVPGALAQPSTLCDASLSCAGGLSCYLTPAGASDPYTCVSAATPWFSCPGLPGVVCANNVSYCPAPGSGSSLCACPSSGRLGAYCEFNATTCPSGTLLCANGGACAGTYCRCPDTSKWISVRCTLPVLAAAQAPPRAAPPGTVNVPTWVAAPIVVGVVALLFCGCTVFYLVYRERKGTPVFHKLDDQSAGVTRGQGLVMTAISRDVEAK
jgi:hypothetical protein